tara:strand:+ start:79 stop:384 length:306 start_codon:yes stop_codon:yes gene_type:complete
MKLTTQKLRQLIREEYKTLKQKTMDARRLPHSTPEEQEARMAAVKENFLNEMYELLFSEFGTDDRQYNDQVLKRMIQEFYDQLRQAQLKGQEDFNKRGKPY